MDVSSEPTLVSLLLDRIAADGDRPAISFRSRAAIAGGAQGQGGYETRTWNEVAADARRLAAALIQRGVKPGDRVVQFSENRYEWIVCDMAILLVAAVHVPIHAPLTGQQAAYQIADSGANVVFFSTPEQAEKLAAAAEQIPADVDFFAYDPCDREIKGRPVTPLCDLTAGISDDAAADVEQCGLHHTQPESLTSILYTSGTTGEPKGVMLSQRNLASNAIAALEMFDQQSTDLRINFLPLSHIFARTCDLYTWTVSGSQLALAASKETVLEDCAALSPTLINGVPYFYEKLQRYLQQQGLGDQPGALRKLLGGRMRLCCTGGAALPDHVYDFFQQQKLPLLQGYGLSETSPVITASSQQRSRRGSAGPAIPGVEIRTAEDGEIFTRGPHVMIGYYKNQQATDQIIHGGWLATGDLGRIDEDGFLYITGRKKEIIVTSGGKNVSPVYLESLLTEDPLFEQALVVGDGRNYLTALIFPNAEKLAAELAARQISPEDREGVLAFVQSQVDQRLQSVSHYEQIRRIALLKRSFTIESGELTPKLSLRREVIQTNYRTEIEALYAAK